MKPGERDSGDRVGRLTGETAIVTGGGKGVGRTICLELAAEGADVAVIAHSDIASAEETAAEVRKLGRRTIALKTDITDRHAVETMIDTVCNALGVPGVLVNNAGRTAHAPLEALSVADWDAVFAVNAKGTFLCCVAAAKRMIPARRGVIVNIAGASAHRSYPFAGGYGPAKAAVVNLTRQMSLEWARHGIRVNGVSPGPIREADTGWQAHEPELAEEVSRLPLQRAVTPTDVARAVVFLASSDAAATTGHMLLVDSGGVNTWYLAPQRFDDAES